MDELQKQKNQMEQEKQQQEEANSEPVEALDNRAEQFRNTCSRRNRSWQIRRTKSKKKCWRTNKRSSGCCGRKANSRKRSSNNRKQITRKLMLSICSLSSRRRNQSLKEEGTTQKDHYEDQIRKHNRSNPDLTQTVADHEKLQWRTNFRQRTQYCNRR